MTRIPKQTMAGVMFLALQPAVSVQGRLLDAPDFPARQRLMWIIDRVNARVSGTPPASRERQATSGRRSR